MRSRPDTERFATLLLAALGFAPACGGAVTTSAGTGGNDGSAASGQAGEEGGSGGTRAGAGGFGAAGSGGSAGAIASGGMGGDIATGGGGGDVIGSGGTGGAGVGGSFGDAGGAANVNPYPCVDMQNLGGGYAQCQNGMTHRANKATCPSLVPRPAPIAPTPDAGGADATAPRPMCTRDSDCSAGDHGYCARPGPGLPSYAFSCTYGCVQDSECMPGSVCVCGDPVGRCVSAACTVDGECGAGLVCGSYERTPGCPSTSYACQTVLDQCASDSGCGPEMYCSVAQGHRSCAPRACVVGRPFLIAGAARVAERGGAAAWREVAAGVTAISASPAVRARLAEEWTQIALMEHASIAAFARFTLQLLSLGAPADLVRRSNAAALDETRHAQFAFAVASSYADSEVGPGALDLSGAFAATSLADIVRNVVREGCVGETIAAVEAAEAAKLAVDPGTRSALEAIAEDELAHAELAWRFVRWAIASSAEDLRSIVRAELHDAERAERRSSERASLAPSEEQRVLAGGVVVGELREHVRRAAMIEVVLPCARALLGDGPTPRAVQTSRLTT